MNEELKNRLLDLIYVLVFLIGMTWFWYGPRENLASVGANINSYMASRNVEVISNDDIKIDGNTYNFDVKNKTNNKINYEIIIGNDYKKVRKNNCTAISNNYISYKLLDNQFKTLNIDGIIYKGELDANKKDSFNISLDMIKNNDKCYYPVVKATTYYKV